MIGSYFYHASRHSLSVIVVREEVQRGPNRLFECDHLEIWLRDGRVAFGPWILSEVSLKRYTELLSGPQAG